MRVKTGRKWSKNDPRHIGIGDVTWGPAEAYVPGINGRHTMGHVHVADEEMRRHNSLQQDGLANPGLRGVE
jgi:hypothetical protein